MDQITLSLISGLIGSFIGGSLAVYGALLAGKLGVWSTFFTNDTVPKRQRMKNFQSLKSSSKSLGLMMCTPQNAFRLRKSSSPVTK